MGFNPIEMKFTKTKDKLVRRQYTDMTLADLQNLDGRSIPTEEEQDTSKCKRGELTPIIHSHQGGEQGDEGLQAQDAEQVAEDGFTKEFLSFVL